MKTSETKSFKIGAEAQSRCFQRVLQEQKAARLVRIDRYRELYERAKAKDAEYAEVMWGEPLRRMIAEAGI